jgi:TIR domain
MVAISEIMELLRGKENDSNAIIPIAREYSPLNVKIALLGLACEKRIYNPHWIGCPPSVFLSYKWNGPQSRDYVAQIHDYLVNKGYKVYFDRNELSEDADGYTQVPEYIAHVADCQYYVLILTEKTADYITARNHRTSWIFDEYQQAVTLVNLGRQFLVPLLVEEKGLTGFFTKDNVIDLTKEIYDFTPLEKLFYPVHFKLPENLGQTYNDFLDACDVLIFKRQWNDLMEWLTQGVWFKNFPDFQFRVLIHSICTKNEEAYNFSSKYVADFIPYPQVSRLLISYAKLYQINELSTMFI